MYERTLSKTYSEICIYIVIRMIYNYIERARKVIFKGRKVTR